MPPLHVQIQHALPKLTCLDETTDTDQWKATIYTAFTLS